MSKQHQVRESFNPSMVGKVVAVTVSRSTGKGGTESRMIVGVLQSYSNLDRTALPEITWFQIAGEDEARLASDEYSSVAIETFHNNESETP